MVIIGDNYSVAEHDGTAVDNMQIAVVEALVVHAQGQEYNLTELELENQDFGVD